MAYERSLSLLPAVVLLVGGALAASPSAADVYELRTYTTNEGKLDALNARFRDHTVRLFEKHGIESVGYWVPTDEERSKNTLIYVIKHKSRDAAKASWKAFLADPEWKKAAKESGVGALANPPVSVFAEATDFSPAWKNEKTDGEAAFELRIYRCNEGELGNLDARFRDHTIGIFDRFGMRSVAYWHPTDEPDSKDTLIYLLRHDSREAGTASWKAFGADEEWKKVAVESQKDGRFLRERPESIYMKATDYSAIQ